MEFINNEIAFNFNGSDSFMFIPNANAANINITFWLKVDIDTDTYIAYSNEGNWVIEIKNKRLLFNNIQINDKDIIPNKWYYVDVNIYSEDSNIQSRLISNIQEAIKFARKFETKQFKCSPRLHYS